MLRSSTQAFLTDSSLSSYSLEYILREGLLHTLLARYLCCIGLMLPSLTE